MKKRPISLLEVMIALVLASILFGVLFYAQKENALARAHVEKVSSLVMERERARLRLNQIFNGMKTAQVEGGRLIVKYDNCLDIDPDFCGILSSELYIENGALFLATTGKEGKRRTDCLINGIKTVAFSFFDEDKNEWGQVVPKQPLRMLKVILDNVEIPFLL